MGHRRPLGSAPCISDADVFILKYLLLSRQIWFFFLFEQDFNKLFVERLSDDFISEIEKESFYYVKEFEI